MRVPWATLVVSSVSATNLAHGSAQIAECSLVRMGAPLPEKIQHPTVFWLGQAIIVIAWL